MGKISMGVAFVAGYVVGARAGRQRYQQLKQQATRVAEQPQVQQMTQRVADAVTEKLQQNRRTNAALQKARELGTAIGRRPRGSGSQTAETLLVPQPPAPPVDQLLPPNEQMTNPRTNAAGPLDQP